MLDAFQFPFMQRALLELLLLAPIAGFLGAQIVLRGLAFHAHGVGAATFPGLVAAGPVGVPAGLAALAAGLGFSGLSLRLGGRRLNRDALTALLVVAFLAAGVILASDVYESGSEVDQLLFGSLLAIGPDELWTGALVLAVTLIATATARRTWISRGFDGGSGGAADVILMIVLAAAVVATIDAVGALLVSAILVLPAATARLFARSVAQLELAAIAIAVVVGTSGLLIAFELDAPPGASIATLAGIVFALAVGVSRLGQDVSAAGR